MVAGIESQISAYDTNPDAMDYFLNSIKHLINLTESDESLDFVVQNLGLETLVKIICRYAVHEDFHPYVLEIVGSIAAADDQNYIRCVLQD
jgi:hypothetical protein